MTYIVVWYLFFQNFVKGEVDMKCGNVTEAYKFDCLSDMPLGSAYVPWQKFEQVFEADKGYMCGSIFAELVFPFYGARAACQGMSNGRRNMYGQNR